MQIIAVILILVSTLPCLFALINIPGVIQYAQATGNNASLRIIVPLLIAIVFDAAGFGLMFISLLLKTASPSQ